MKCNFTIILILFLLNTLLSQVSNQIDIKNIEILRDKKDFLFLKMDLMNNGNAKIENPTSKVKTDFYITENLPANLTNYKSQIIELLSLEKFTIQPHESINWYIKIEKSKIDTTKKVESNIPIKYEIDNCPDLLITEYKIAKSTKNYIWLEYTIVNRGRKPANLYGYNTNDVNDNVTIKAVLSTSSELTNVYWDAGSVLVDGGLKTRNGIIKPQESYTDLIKVDLSGQSKFTKYIILQLDPYLTIQDCNRSNNNLTIKIK